MTALKGREPASDVRPPPGGRDQPRRRGTRPTTRRGPLGGVAFGGAAGRRWAQSDLRTHRGEALFLVLATAGIVASLLLATALFGYATNPWQRIFTQARGAHVWIHTVPFADTRKLARLDGVESVAGPYRTESATVAVRGSRASVELRGVLPARSECV